MKHPRFGSGFETLEAREVPATAVVDGIQFSYPDALREPSPTVADQVLVQHAAYTEALADMEAASFEPQWPGVNGDVRGVLEGVDNNGIVHAVAFSADGTKMVTTGQNTVTLRNAVTGQLIRELPVHPSQITSADFSPDGTKLVTVSWDKTAKLINVADGAVLKSTPILNIGSNVRFMADGVRIMISSADQPLQMWNTSTQWIVSMNNGGSILGDLREDHDSIVYAQNRDVVVRSIANGTESRFTGLSTDANASAMSTDGTLVAGGDAGPGYVKVWNRSSGACIATLPAMGGTVVDMKFLPGKILLVSGAFNAVKVWNLAGSSPVLLKTYGVSGAERFSMAPNSDLIGIASGTSVRLLKLPDGLVAPASPSPAAIAAAEAAKSSFAGTLNTAWDDDWSAYGGVNIDAIGGVTTAALQGWMNTLASADATPLEVLEYRLAGINAEIAALEEQRPLVTVTPSMTTTAYRNDVTHLSVAVTNMAANIYVRFGSVLTYLPTGTGTVKIPLASFTHGDRRVYNVELVRANGTVLESNLGGFGIQSGAHTYGGYNYDPASVISSVASLPQQVPGNLPAELQSRMTELQAEKTQVESEIAALTPEDEEDPPELTDLATAQSVADSIAALTTDENGNTLSADEIAERLEAIRARTQRDQREAALAIPVLRTRIATLSASLPLLQQAVDDAATAGQWDYAYGRLSATQLEIADCERMLQGANTAFEGLNAMRDAEMEVSVVGISGTQLVLEVVNAPASAYFLGFREDRDGHHYLGWRPYFSHHFTANPDGSTLVAIPFNGTIPTGDFQLRMMIDGQEVCVAERQMVCWNKDTTQVSLGASSFSHFASFATTDGLQEPSWGEQQAARDAAHTLALGAAPAYVYWEPSYSNINATLQERVWTALGMTINRETLARAIAHARSPQLVGAVQADDAALRTAYIQAAGYGSAGDVFDLIHTDALTDGYRLAGTMIDTYQQGVVTYFTHLLKLKTGSASTFDARPFQTPYPDLVPPAPVVMARIAERFDILYTTLGGVQTTQNEWLAQQESMSVYLGNRETRIQNEANAIHLRLQQIESLTGKAADESAVATILANHPNGVETYFAMHHSTVFPLLAVNQSTAAVFSMVDRFILATYLAGNVHDGDSAFASRHFAMGGSADASSEAEEAITVLSGYSDREIYRSVRSWYDGNQTPFMQQLSLRRDTIVGQILMGGLDRLWKENTTYGRWFIALEIEAITGIPASTLEFIRRNSEDNQQKFITSAQRVMNNEGYGHLLDNQASTVSNPGFVFAKPDSDSPYATRDVAIRIDVFGAGSDIRRIAVRDLTGRLLMTTAATTVVRIPLSLFNQSGSGVKVMLEATLTNGTTLQIQTEAFTVAPTSVPTIASPSSNDFSVAAAGSPNHEAEQTLLASLNSSIQGTIVSNSERSDLHASYALYALDVFGSGNGLEVVATAGVSLQQADVFAGQLVLKQYLPNGRVGYITYYHLKDILEGVSGVSYTGLDEALETMNIDSELISKISNAIKNRHGVQATLEALNLPADVQSQIQPVIDTLIFAQKEIEKLYGRILSVSDGVLGREANEGESTGRHLHVNANFDTMHGTPINLFQWLERRQPGVQTTLEVMKGQQMVLMNSVWKPEVGALVSNAEKLAFVRETHNGDAVNMVYAWEQGKTINEMVKVIWVHQLNDGRIVDAWLPVDDYSKKWNPSTQAWSNL